MEKISDILARIFTDPAPCCGCARALPTFRDRETGKCFCVGCLEEAVAASQAEMIAERQDMARHAACFGQLAR